MTDVKVGMLVEVTLHGEVTRLGASGFWVRPGGQSHQNWVPLVSSWTVLSPPRPKEVILLECGHVADGPRPSSPSELVYCNRCWSRQGISALGRVTW